MAHRIARRGAAGVRQRSPRLWRPGPRTIGWRTTGAGDTDGAAAAEGRPAEPADAVLIPRSRARTRRSWPAEKSLAGRAAHC
ncbi:hypothetical protein GCM10010390_77770 [Streptomyces mordarskii]|uniref:Uncharacterized protein n=1 Tax=Streptomyces mordarskii TaxID=1226758 RepID=A0ABP3PFI1_9ACTN